jgi:2-amino-4-hydroxy-6-hydroxymethyldihydropteridine diphosphokinase
MHKVYLGLGSNLGDREQNLREAIRLISERVGQVRHQSSFLQTAPWGFESEHEFLNAVILCQTEKTPRQVLTVTQQIERDMGRKEKTTLTYQDRPIDIDILRYDDLTVNEPDLQIPHPLMHQRDFVMIPLREVLEKENNELK